MMHFELEARLAEAQKEGLQPNVRRWLRFRGLELNEWIELQTLATRRKVVQGYGGGDTATFAHCNGELLICALAGQLEPVSTGVYMIGNKVSDAVSTRKERGTWHAQQKGASTTDSDITHRLVLLIDGDARRPSGTSATDEEMAHAVQMMLRVYERLIRDLPPACLAWVHSGNGRQVLVALEPTPCSGETDAIVKGILCALGCLFSAERAEIDGSVGDRKRLMPLPGTLKRKGAPDVADRPHRRTAIICDEKVARVTFDDLRRVLGTLRVDLNVEQNALVDKAMGKKAPTTEAARQGDAGHGRLGPYAAAKDVPIVDVLAWKGLLDGEHPVCPGCGSSDNGVAVVENILKCSHKRCAGKGVPGREGVRTTIDVVMECEGVDAREAVNALAAQFGFGGLKAKRDRASREPVLTAGEAWETKLVTSREGNPQTGLGNVTLILSNHAAFAGRVAHNEFTHQAEVVKPLPWDAAEFAHREWTDNDDTRTAGWLQLEYRFAPSTEMVAKAIATIASEASFHPVVEYLNRCADSWDGKKRIDNLFLSYFGARVVSEKNTNDGDRNQVERTNRYLGAVGRRFLISAVARIMRPGCKVDTMPIVDGVQGALKSSAFRALAEPWFTDELSTPGGKDADEQLRGVWVVELAELEQLDKTEMTRIKGFLSRQEDRFRWSYGRRVVAYARQNVFVGTTNHDEWGRDETGARRMWPVSVRGVIDVAGIKRDRDQLWGEAVHALRAGEQWHLTREEEALARTEQEEHRQGDPWETPMREYLAPRNSATVSDILGALGIDKGHWDQRAQNRVARIFRAWKWRQSRVRTDVGRERRYFRPELNPVRVEPDPDQSGSPQSASQQEGGPGGPGGPGTQDELACARTHARDPRDGSCDTVPDRPQIGCGPADHPDQHESNEDFLDRVLPFGGDA